MPKIVNANVIRGFGAPGLHRVDNNVFHVEPKELELLQDETIVYVEFDEGPSSVDSATHWYIASFRR